MFTKSKIAAFALATLTLTAAVAATSTEAKATDWGGVGIGFAAGALIGAAAAQGPYYGGPAYVVAPTYRCRWVRMYDNLGFYIGKQRVCGGSQVVVY